MKEAKIVNMFSCLLLLFLSIILHQVQVDGGAVWEQRFSKILELKGDYRPSIEEPFVFFHIPKTAGTSLRAFFFDLLFEHQIQNVTYACSAYCDCYCLPKDNMVKHACASGF